MSVNFDTMFELCFLFVRNVQFTELKSVKNNRGLSQEKILNIVVHNSYERDGFPPSRISSGQNVNLCNKRNKIWEDMDTASY